MSEEERNTEPVLPRPRAGESQEDDRAAPAHGRLKIFFSYAPGVGATRTMLEAARAAATAGREVVMGCIASQGGPDVQPLLFDLELMTLGPVGLKGGEARGLNLDAALERRPELILVDELAHANPVDSRHAKRWQDVQELLRSGVDVWTTLNVQHLESVNDIVAQITGVCVQETVPDRMFDEAAEVELVDLPPDELLERFRDGKIHVTERDRSTTDRLYRRASLVALREITMRRVADRVGREVQSARLGGARRQIWPTHERLLVCVGPSPTSAKVIRTAKRMATAMHAEWMAVHSETTGQRLDTKDRQRLAAHLKLAAQLGAETITLSGDDIAEEIVQYAETRNVTKIVLGKTGKTRGYRFWRRSIVDKLLDRSGDIDVYVIRGVEENPPTVLARASRKPKPAAYAKAAALLTGVTAFASVFRGLGLTDAELVMAYLLIIVVIAARLGRGPAIASSIVSVLLFNFFFTTPYYTFVVDDTQYLFTFAVMLVIALLVSALTARIRAQVDLARDREQRIESLYRVSRRMAATSGRLQLVSAAQEQLNTIFPGEVVVFLPDDGVLRPVLQRGTGFAEEPSEAAAACWVFEHGQPAGRSTDTLPVVQALYVPMPGRQGNVGVIGWCPEEPEQLVDIEQRQLLDALATQIALALERDVLAEEAQHILAQAEVEKLRSSLLSAVSHDLRTPLAAIAGSASSLVDARLDDSTRRELAQTVFEESDRLSRLVENLLHLTRIESGSMKVEKQWQPLDEVIGTALRRLDRVLLDRKVRVDIPADTPLVPLDGLLIEQVLVNLVENAAKYSPGGSPIEIGVRKTSEGTEICVADHGPGLDPQDRARVFEKFFRSPKIRSDRGRGAGLGLAICQAIVQAHGGRIWVEPRDDEGTCFKFTLPDEGQPPEVDAEEPTVEESHRG